MLATMPLSMSVKLSIVAVASAWTVEPMSSSQKGPDAVLDPRQVPGRSGPGPNGLARTPPMGWMSWEVFRCQTNCVDHPDACINHNLYEQMTDRLADEGYLEAGYVTVSIDDCWEDHHRDADGRLWWNATRFPAGMKPLGD